MLKSFLKRHQKRHLRSEASGFTLLELLVAMLVGSLISAGLLFIVVQLIETNLRESARSDTQRDLQAAIDYIARDVREAVFVYDAVCLLDRPAKDSPNYTRCPGLRSYLPDRIVGTTGFGATDTIGKTINVPVLAFWRVNPLPEELKTLCSNNSAAYSSATLPSVIQNVPCLSGRMYSLVVYSLNRDNSGAVSRGRARIMRYELPQFTASSVGTTGTTAVPGWVSPRGKTNNGKETSFLAWPVDRTSLADSTPTSLQQDRDSMKSDNTNTLPLTDFVDWTGLYGGRAPDRSAEGLVLTPSNGTSAAADPPRGFYVYVRGGDREGDLNQEVVIRIQGDAAGRAGAPDSGATDRPSVPVSLETRVLTRGVTNKTQ